MKSRRWAGHVAHMGDREVHTGFWWGNLREGNHLKDKGIDGRIILKWICKTWDEKAWTGLIWLGLGTGSRRLWML